MRYFSGVSERAVSGSVRREQLYAASRMAPRLRARRFRKRQAEPIEASRIASWVSQSAPFQEASGGSSCAK